MGLDGFLLIKGRNNGGGWRCSHSMQLGCWGTERRMRSLHHTRARPGLRAIRPPRPRGRGSLLGGLGRAAGSGQTLGGSRRPRGRILVWVWVWVVPRVPTAAAERASARLAQPLSPRPGPRFGIPTDRHAACSHNSTPEVVSWHLAALDSSTQHMPTLTTATTASRPQGWTQRGIRGSSPK